LENARLQLEYCTIRSPIDARAGDRITDLGNMVTPNVTPLVLLTQIKPIYVTFTVPEKYLSAIQRQMAAGPLRVEAAIPGDSGPPKRGVLTFLDNRVDAATGTIRLKGTFANEDRGLWPGRFVDVTLILATRKNVVVVPSQAIQARPDGQFVFVVRPDRTVEFRKVLTGETVADRAAVTEGLKPGETVVAEGQLRLVPGARVEVQNVEPGVAREADSTTPRAVSRPAS
jgi:multidrug efflux system membrane fusion protein